MIRSISAATTLLLAPLDAMAEDAAPPLPSQLAALAGCWQGEGTVMGNPVSIELTARPVAMNAILSVDAESRATTDATDRHSAHLVFGSVPASTGASERIVGYWADSFGGAFTSTGEGQTRATGFEITYPYSDADFVNRWHVSGRQMTWNIVARQKDGAETPFAHYLFEQHPCPSSAAER